MSLKIEKQTNGLEEASFALILSVQSRLQALKFNNCIKVQRQKASSSDLLDPRVGDHSNGRQTQTNRQIRQTIVAR